MSNFPTKENPQLCINGCGAKIYLDNFTGKYRPYNLDDTEHNCKNNGKQEKIVRQEQHKNATVTLKVQKQEFTLEDVQNKLASIGIILNVERLMKQ